LRITVNIPDGRNCRFENNILCPFARIGEIEDVCKLFNKQIFSNRYMMPYKCENCLSESEVTKTQEVKA
jgi:hypothetical protein